MEMHVIDGLAVLAFATAGSAITVAVQALVREFRRPDAEERADHFATVYPNDAEGEAFVNGGLVPKSSHRARLLPGERIVPVSEHRGSRR